MVRTRCATADSVPRRRRRRGAHRANARSRFPEMLTLREELFVAAYVGGAASGRALRAYRQAGFGGSAASRQRERLRRSARQAARRRGDRCGAGAEAEQSGKRRATRSSRWSATWRTLCVTDLF